MSGTKRHFPRFAAAYGLAHFGKSLFWSSGEGLFVFYLTEICGLAPFQAGLVIGGALQFSALADLLVLALCRGRLARLSGVLTLQAVGAGLTAVFFLLFALTAWLPAGYRFGAALFGSLAFRTAYALLDVPQNALLGLVPDNPLERTRLASIRMVGSGSAGLCVSGLAYFLIAGPNLAATGLAAACIGAVATAGALSTWAASPRSDVIGEGGPALGWRTRIAPRAAWLLMVGAAGAAASTSLAKLLPYFAAYGLRSPMAGGLLMATLALGGVLSQPFWLWLAGRRARGAAIMTASLVLLAASALFYPASSAGLRAALPCAAAQGAAVGGLGTLVWSALGDEARSSVSATVTSALLFALLTFVSKTALAATVVFLTLFLAAHPYRGLGVTGEWPLLPMLCLMPMVLAGVCLVAARFSPTPEKKTSL